jgi:hypothetical protein
MRVLAVRAVDIRAVDGAGTSIHASALREQRRAFAQYPSGSRKACHCFIRVHSFFRVRSVLIADHMKVLQDWASNFKVERKSPMSSDGKSIETTKELAATRQIHAAILLFRIEQEFECAITLAAAAEGLLPQTDEPHIFKILKGSPAFKELDLNRFITWLKHSGGPDGAEISEFEVTLVIVRAISKFAAVYKTQSGLMSDFVKWSFEKGHLPAPPIETGQ